MNGKSKKSQVFFVHSLLFSLRFHLVLLLVLRTKRESVLLLLWKRNGGKGSGGGGAPDFTEISAKTQETHSPLSFSFLSSSFFLLSLFLSLSLSIKKNEFRLSTPTAPGEEKLFPSSEDSVSPSLSSVDIDVFFL